jgi:hypothetical protein
VRTLRFYVLSLVGLVASHAPLAFAAAPDTIQTQVRHAYPVTKFRPDRMQVLDAGTLLTVQRPGILATPIIKGVYFVTTYKRGKLSRGFGSTLGELATESGTFPVNERVYLIKIDVDSKKSTITLHIESCGTCDPAAPDPYHLPQRGAVKFDFEKGAFDSINLGTVQGTIAAVFGNAVSAPPEPPVVTSLAAQPDPGVQPQAEPPAPPAKIEMGQSPDQVRSIFGPPADVISLGSKQIYLYPNLKITFVDGKVSDVQ